MREHGSRTSPWTPTGRSPPSTSSRSASPARWATPTCSLRWTWRAPAARGGCTDEHRSCWRADTPCSTRSLSPTSWTPWSGGRRGDRDRDHRTHQEFRREGSPGDATSCCPAWPPPAGVRAQVLRRHLPSGAGIESTCPTVPASVAGAAHTVMNLDAGLPEEPDRSDRRVPHERYSVEIFVAARGCRFCQAGMITARCGSAARRSPPWSTRAHPRDSRRSACSPCRAPTTARSARSPRTSRTVGTHTGYLCPPPGSAQQYRLGQRADP